MKPLRLTFLISLFLAVASCGPDDKGIIKKVIQKTPGAAEVILPLDKGFSEYITGYTSGIIPANSPIEIRFAPEFAASAKKLTTGIFNFTPPIKGKTEWTDDKTLVFTPSKLLDPGKTYMGEVNISKLGTVKERLKIFPLRIQTLKKEFSVSTGYLRCQSDASNTYTLDGEIVASDFIDPAEVECYIEARLDREKMTIAWDHSDNLVHRFTVSNITRERDTRKLLLEWNGSRSGVKQKGSFELDIPASGVFKILDVITLPGDNQKVDIIFSDPLDASQDTEGLIYFDPAIAMTTTINSNIVTIVLSSPFQKSSVLNLEKSIRNNRGASLSDSFSTSIDFSISYPEIKFTGEGVILPSSKNLIFPFKATNLKAVDLKIVKIFENNLPYFLQENDISTGYYVKRFGRPVYAGRINLVPGTVQGSGSWKLYTIDLADYIDIEPGILYRIELSMRKSYSLLSCPLTEEETRYEERLEEELNMSRASWDDTDDYYEESFSSIYYSFDFEWEDRDDPCKEAYYSPDKCLKRNILASNIGLIAKMGEDNILHVMTNDLLTALPVSEVSIDVYDYQMQLIISGNTDPDGSVSLFCGRKPFLVIARKDKDRNYLKLNDGNSLSLSSFDVSGTRPENGIKAFIYGERDVWRPGDSIYLSVFIRDMKNDLPPQHPVQFELINPLEQRVDNQVQKLAGSNLLVFATRTSPDAVTGNYRAVIKIGGATFIKQVRIETIKPNRLKINLTFPGDFLGGTRNGTATGSLNVKWLNGSVARNLKASVDYLLKQTKTEFRKYEQYDFNDPVVKFNSETVNVFDNTVDDNGNATIKFDPGDELNAPGMLNAVFTAKVQEQGGDESITVASFKYAPFPLFVGIKLPGLSGKSRMLFTDTDNEVKIVTVDARGNPVRSEVELTIYKLSYRWWWESDDEDLAYYISNRFYKPVISKNIVTPGGEASFTFNIDKNDWGRYLIRATTAEGHSTGKMLLIDWPWEYGMKNNVDGATLLAVSTDKDKYCPGDEIKLSFPSPANSRAIITLENATGVLDEIRVPTDKAITEARFKATPEMAPNVYAYISVIQPHGQTVNDMPIRLYGVVPVMVEDPSTRLSPVLTVADEIRSRKTFDIKVSEANRTPMTYTLAVVDEGLLDITGYKTPDPWNYFYAREALGVKTWDLYDNVLGAFGGTLEKIFAVGGDETVIDRSANKAKRFIPVVRFLGPFRLASGKTNTHSLTLPQYTGSVKTMVIAGNDRAFGTADKSVLVKDPLMVLVTAPRVISPGEKAALPVTLFIQKENIKEVTITAEGNNLITFDESSRNITVKGIGEENTEFVFAAGEKTGTGKIKVVASANGEMAVHEMEIEIRSPNPPETRAEMSILFPGKKWETKFKPMGIEGSNSAHLEISALPSVNLEKRLDYLVNYPHGCTEQVTSAAFPQLWLKDLAENDPGITAKTTVNIREAIDMIISRQMAGGGVAPWPGAYQADNWVTSYTGHFLIEAERHGYKVPSGFRQKWLDYQKKTAQEWRFDPQHAYSANDQAYRLFSLALAGQPEKGPMNRLRETPSMPRLARWLLAAAFATSGKAEAADELLDMRIVETEPEYNYYYYGSQIRDKSIILYTLALLNKQDIALPLFRDICEKIGSESWYSTQSLAWGLYAYMKYIDMMPAGKNTPVKARITLNGQISDQMIGAKQLWSKELKMSADNSLAVENNSENTAYVTLVRKGIPLVSNTEIVKKGLDLSVTHVNMNHEPLDHHNLIQGTDFMMVVKVTNKTFSRVDNIALSEMVPSGWEIQNTRLYEANRGIKESSYDYRDIRDDRVNTYFSLNQGESKTFVLILNAAYKGEFFLPPVWCEAMYSENVHARIPGGMVKVTGE
jgi:hypothetical protein